MIKLIIMAIGSGLFWWGGYSWHDARRFLLPLLLTATCYFITGDARCLIMLCSCLSFCLGYGEKSPLRHIFGNGWGRGVWGLLSALALSLPLLLIGHVYLFFFLPYLVLNFVLENALKDIPQAFGDTIIGCGLCLIVFLAHP